MAIWQCCFEIIPEGHDVTEIRQCPWCDMNIEEDAFDKLNMILPKRESWNDEIIQYGHNDKTCVELILENEEVCEIVLRIDLREISEKMIVDILDFVGSINAQLSYQDRLISREKNHLINILKESDQFKFVSNPLGFFKEKR